MASTYTKSFNLAIWRRLRDAAGTLASNWQIKDLEQQRELQTEIETEHPVSMIGKKKGAIIEDAENQVTVREAFATGAKFFDSTNRGSQRVHLQFLTPSRPVKPMFVDPQVRKFLEENRPRLVDTAWYDLHKEAHKPTKKATKDILKSIEKISEVEKLKVLHSLLSTPENPDFEADSSIHDLKAKIKKKAADAKKKKKAVEVEDVDIPDVMMKAHDASRDILKPTFESNYEMQHLVIPRDNFVEVILQFSRMVGMINGTVETWSKQNIAHNFKENKDPWGYLDQLYTAVPNAATPMVRFRGTPPDTTK